MFILFSLIITYNFLVTINVGRAGAASLDVVQVTIQSATAPL